MKMMLEISVWENFVKWLSMPEIWVALALVIIGTSLVFLARRITRVVRKSNSIDDKDKTFITIKCIGIAMMFLALMIIVFIR